MSSKQLAITALEKQINKIEFDANLYDMGIADYPYAQKCSEKRKKLLEAIENIKQGATRIIQN